VVLSIAKLARPVEFRSPSDRFLKERFARGSQPLPECLQRPELGVQRRYIGRCPYTTFVKQFGSPTEKDI